MQTPSTVIQSRDNIFNSAEATTKQLKDDETKGVRLKEWRDWTRKYYKLTDLLSLMKEYIKCK
jgi:hypothetical protein